MEKPDERGERVDGSRCTCLLAVYLLHLYISTNIDIPEERGERVDIARADEGDEIVDSDVHIHCARLPFRASGVSVCTFVLVKQVN
jgi:hypothetical protein